MSQKVPRHTFKQAGNSVQRIDQPGTWAIITDSRINGDWHDGDCLDGVHDPPGYHTVSRARWVYTCRRVVKQHSNDVAELLNGEYFRPCYTVNPLSERRLPNGTIVWLEPLPQLNGYIIIPGDGRGLRRACDSYGGYGSDGSYGDWDSWDDWWPGGNPNKLCETCLGKLCVERDSAGNIVNIYYRSGNGLIKVPDCGDDYWDSYGGYGDYGGYGGSGGHGGDPGGGAGVAFCGDCAPEHGRLYQLRFRFIYLGNVIEGLFLPGNTSGRAVNTPERKEISFNPGDGQRHIHHIPPMCQDIPEFIISLFCEGDSESWSFIFNASCQLGQDSCHLSSGDVNLSANCAANPSSRVYVVSVLPGRCINGYFFFEPFPG